MNKVVRQLAMPARRAGAMDLALDKRDGRDEKRTLGRKAGDDLRAAQDRAGLAREAVMALGRDIEEAVEARREAEARPLGRGRDDGGHVVARMEQGLGQGFVGWAGGGQLRKEKRGR